MATTTTQILFNSPALHSLKRDQLVKLCKLHSIKANGKNAELIERLKQRALELPPEAQHPPCDEDDRMDEDADAPDIPGAMPMDADPAPAPPAASDNDDDYEMQDVVLTSRFSIARPSEQWEVVMEDIAEVDETMGTASSKNSLKTVSNGEFGTHTSKSTMSSSLKAFANSLGIKRATSKASHRLPDSDNTTTDSDTNPKMPSSFSPGKLLSTRARDSLAEHAVPYAEIPPTDTLPDTDHFKFSTPDASILAPSSDDGHDDGDGDGDSCNPNPSPSTIRLGPAAVRSTIRLVSHPAMPKRTGPDAAYMSPPRLPVVQTDFDILAGTPGTVRTLNVWPASPRSVGGGSLYPKLPLDDGDDDDDAMPGAMGGATAMATPAKTPARSLASPSKGRWTGKSTPGPVDEQDMFSPAKPAAPAPAPAAVKVEAAPTPARAVPRSAPFLFGSPLPRRPTTSTTTATATVSKHKGINKAAEDVEEHPSASADADADADADVGGVSNAAFDGVAKSILEEMHRRIAASNANNHNGKPALTSLPAPPVFSFAPPPAPGEERFAKAHAAEFSKMDSITSHYAARRPPKRKSDALGHGHAGRPSAGQKRRSSAAGARVISAGARRKMGVPGGFGADDSDMSDDELREEAGRGAGAREQEEEREEEEDAGARRSSKRIRITEGWDVHRAGQRVSLAPPLPPADEEKKVKEREAVKRELDAAKARRRSSRGRPSMGVGAQPAKAKSRFGFFGAAKSLVRNVWNMGGASSKAKPAAPAPATAPAHPAPPSNIPVPKAAQQPAPADKRGEKGKAAEVVPAAPNARKTSVSKPNKLLKPPPSAADAKNTGTISSTKSMGLRSRSPIPSFSPPPVPSGTVKSTATAALRSSSMAGTTRSRVSSTGTGNGTAASRQTTRTSTASSMGTRTSVTSGTAVVSSMGTRRSTSSSNTHASTSSKPEAKSPETKDQPSLRKRPSSLLAPTASSLAKTNATARQSNTGRTSGLPPVAEAFKPKRTSAAQAAASSRAAVMSPRGPSQQHPLPQSRGQSPLSPRPTRIFSQPLTNFGLSSSPPRSGSESPASPAYGHPSLTAAAATIMNSGSSSPSKIPRPAVLPPKPKQLIARKPRISRSKVIAKLGAQRAAAAQGGSSSLGSPSGSGAGTRTRSSMGARRSFGGVKTGRASAGAEVMRSAVKKRARQSEYIRRRSRANENESVAGDD